jgi:hypothetical protein
MLRGSAVQVPSLVPFPPAKGEVLFGLHDLLMPRLLSLILIMVVDIVQRLRLVHTFLLLLPFSSWPQNRFTGCLYHIDIPSPHLLSLLPAPDKM